MFTIHAVVLLRLKSRTDQLKGTVSPGKGVYCEVKFEALCTDCIIQAWYDGGAADKSRSWQPVPIFLGETETRYNAYSLGELALREQSPTVSRKHEIVNPATSMGRNNEFAMQDLIIFSRRRRDERLPKQQNHGKVSKVRRRHSSYTKYCKN